MDRIESQITELLRSKLPGARPLGLIKCDAAEGVVGFTGHVESGFFRRKKLDISDILHRTHTGEPDFSDLLARLREASRAMPEGPLYRCDIGIDGRTISYRYYWENTPFESVHEIERGIDGHVPNFVLARRFDRALVPELTDFDANNALFFYVPARIKQGKPVSGPLLEVFATLEWQSDVNNGAMNQYFARDHEPMTGLERSQLYGATHRGLLRIGCSDAASLFAESISLYAHFYPRVEAARNELGFAEIPRQDQSDIMNRYYALDQSLDDCRVKYIRTRIAELEQSEP